ncbi:MAG: hypothetical protein QF535_03630, partial [Anaerolineales bacterium]|nr:hypothetical protein [Anaerolineales bacterium]
ASKIEGVSFATSHELTLPSLTASTTYYYLVVSTDESENTSTSTEQSFETTSEPEPADETPPVISGVGISDIATTTAVVNWTTDEAASGTVYYGTDDPLTVASTTLSVSHGSFLTDHSLGLSSLISSTTYQFIIVSSDILGNISTSTEDSFSTI